MSPVAAWQHLCLGLALSVLLACASAPKAPSLSPREQATVLLQRGDGKAAVPILEQLAERSPDDLAIARALAEAHVKAGTASVLERRLSGLDTPVAHYQLGLLLFSSAADASGPAIAHFERAAQLAPNEGEYQYRLGLALLESERYEQSLSPLRRAVELRPETSAWYLPLAKALYRSGASTEAVRALATVVEGAPSAAEVQHARALMNHISDPFATLPKAAKPTFEQGLQWLQVADVPQQAIVSFEQILADYPDLAVVHALLGLAYQRIDDAGRAVEELKRAIELSPEDGKNHLYLAELYLSHQRPKPAEEHLRQALQKNPLLEDAWFRLGDLALERKDLADARRRFRVARYLSPDSVPARGKLALVYQLEHDWPAADRELKAVLDKDPQNLEFMMRLGVLHTDRWQNAKTADERKAAAAVATEWLQKVLEQQPENATASRALETVTGQGGQNGH